MDKLPVLLANGFLTLLRLQVPGYCAANGCKVLLPEIQDSKLHAA